MASRPTANRVKFGGLLIALVGFVLTRYVVAASFSMDIGTVGFLIGELPFLLVGLSLSIFGVALSVSDRQPALVNTIATWCVLGLGSVLLVVVLVNVNTMVATPAGLLMEESVSRLVLAGATGGVLTGVHSARANRHRRELSQRSNRQTVLNRLLRHEVLNKLTVVQGYVGMDHPEADDRIRRNADRIEEVIEQIGFLAGEPANVGVIDLTEAVENAVAEARDRYPEATFRVEDEMDDPIQVRAVTRIEMVVLQLLANAVEHAEVEAPDVTITLDVTEQFATVTIGDEGPGLPAEQQELLQTQSLPRYDDPTTGFGLAIVRLLVDESDGGITVDTDDGTEITLSLARAYDGTAGGVAIERLGEAAVAALIAGVVMGGVLSALSGTIPVIGALYGVENATIGWITHLFHSVVFGLAFAAAVWHPRLRTRIERLSSSMLAGIGYGLALTVLAAGLVMPIWLRATGAQQVALPNITVAGLIGHLLWGVTLVGLMLLFRGLGDVVRDRLESWRR